MASLLRSVSAAAGPLCAPSAPPPLRPAPCPAGRPGRSGLPCPVELPASQLRVLPPRGRPPSLGVTAARPPPGLPPAPTSVPAPAPRAPRAGHLRPPHGRATSPRSPRADV